LWNHALPHGTSRGATWSEDVLWLYVLVSSPPHSAPECPSQRTRIRMCGYKLDH
jgi:hypothetical protein